MSKIKLTFADKKILELQEVGDEEIRDFYTEVDSLDHLDQRLKENNLRLDENFKIAFRHQEDGVLKEIFVVLKENPLPRQYFFNSMQEAQLFSDQQGLEASIHLRPENERESVSQFFKGDECNFPGYKEMKKAYDDEVEKSGGESCTQCARSRIMKKFQALVLDAISENPKNTYSIKALNLNKK